MSAAGPAWYARHSPLTDPGSQAALFDGLPAGAGPLASVVRGLVIHPVSAAG